MLYFTLLQDNRLHLSLAIRIEDDWEFLAS